MSSSGEVGSLSKLRNSNSLQIFYLVLLVIFSLVLVVLEENYRLAGLESSATSTLPTLVLVLVSITFSFSAWVLGPGSWPKVYIAFLILVFLIVGWMVLAQLVIFKGS
jgi:hypothetical protein